MQAFSAPSWSRPRRLPAWMTLVGPPAPTGRLLSSSADRTRPAKSKRMPIAAAPTLMTKRTNAEVVVPNITTSLFVTTWSVRKCLIVNVIAFMPILPRLLRLLCISASLDLIYAAATRSPAPMLTLPGERARIVAPAASGLAPPHPAGPQCRPCAPVTPSRRCLRALDPPFEGSPNHPHCFQYCARCK